MGKVWALGALMLLGAGAALAQEADDGFPNPLRSPGVAATCDNWEAQVAAADPQAMQLVAGVWDSQSMMPGVPGLYADTPVQTRAVNAPDGTFQVQQYACFQMESVPGMAPMPGNCATSMLYGQWVAHFGTDGQSVVIVTLGGGSGFTGQVLPMSCTAGAVRFQDRNTMINMEGIVSRRVG